jgi:hypothetical protein
LGSIDRKLRSSTNELDVEHVPLTKAPKSLLDSWKKKNPSSPTRAHSPSPHSPSSPSSPGSNKSMMGSANQQHQEKEKQQATPASKSGGPPVLTSSPLLANQNTVMAAELTFFAMDSDVEAMHLLHCDVQKVEAWFFNDTTAYIDNTGLLINGIEERYLELRTKCKQKGAVLPVEVPQIQVDFAKQVLHFNKGAHAFAVLRDFKCPTVPLLVKQEQLIDVTMKFVSPLTTKVEVKRTIAEQNGNNRRRGGASTPNKQ